MFNHSHHQKISFILDSLDPELFRKAGAYFGGGTLITLLHDEFRISKDIDFMCPIGEGYRFLRATIADSHNMASALFKRTDGLELPREITANQYGIRFPVIHEGQLIKFEIVSEGRIKLEPPDEYPWTELPCLSSIDRFAEKLLANADRGLDEAIESRDLIDLAVMRRTSAIPPAAIKKAETAYPVLDPLKKVIVKFQQSEGYREKCLTALQIHDRAIILDGLDLLAKDSGLAAFNRTWEEEHS